MERIGRRERKVAVIEQIIGPNVLETKTAWVSDTGPYGLLSDVEIGHQSLWGDIGPASNPVIESIGADITDIHWLAIQMQRPEIVAWELVASCVNSLIARGCIPVSVRDDLELNSFDQNLLTNFFQGLVKACKVARVPIVGGSINEKPWTCPEKGDFNISGDGLGVKDRNRAPVVQDKVEEVEVLIGLPSGGMNCVGLAEAYKILFENGRLALKDDLFNTGKSIAEAMTSPSPIHRGLCDLVLCSMEGGFTFPSVYIKGMAHITRDGFLPNLQAISPHTDATIILYRRVLEKEMPPVFRLIQERGQSSFEEMLEVFSLGWNMILRVHRPFRVGTCPSGN